MSRRRIHVDGSDTVLVADLGPDRDTIRLQGAGEVVDVRVAAVFSGRYVVEIDGRLCTICAVKENGHTWVWWRGRCWRVTEETGEARPGGETAADGRVTPPMPAVVAAVLVRPGEYVEKGRPLVVVSAMKMETRLAAGVSGTVKAVHVTVGQKVRPGDVLVEMSEEDASDE